MKRLGSFIFVAGLLCVIGTLGSVENANIGFLQAGIQEVIGLIMLVAGYILIVKR